MTCNKTISCPAPSSAHLRDLPCAHLLHHTQVSGQLVQGTCRLARTLEVVTLNMRLYTKKWLQLLLAVFLVFVIYLNLNVTDLSSDPHRMNAALPWGDDFHEKRPPLTFSDRKIHGHVHAQMGISNASQSFQMIPITPKPKLDFAIYPNLQQYSDDRIQKQLKFVAESIRRQEKRGESVPVKKILIYSGTSSWHIPRGSVLFKEQKCTVQACELVDDRSKLKEADVVLFQHSPHVGTVTRPTNQIWALFVLESPYHSPSFTNSRNLFNWTATYRHDSTIVAPYEKYVPLNASLLTRNPIKNFASGKTKKVAWFVSNCGARNRRRQYAEELSKYIEVDIYGGCGTFKCPRFQSEKCFGMLNTDYKFYLAFENSNCRDYITEKFFINGLK